MNVLFAVMAIVSFLGMICEEERTSKKCYTVAFVASLVATVTVTMI